MFQLNNAGSFCGYNTHPTVTYHGYYQLAGGRIVAPVDPRGSIKTILFGINDSNWMVGRYEDGALRTHGLLFRPPNTFVTFDYPGANNYTTFSGINRQGLICGSYTGADGNDHGFIARMSR